MSETNPFIKNLKESAGMRLSVLFGSFFILLSLSSVAGAVIDSLPFGDARSHSLASSVVQCLLAFCLPAYLLAHFCSSTPGTWLKLNKLPSLRALIGVVIVYFISMPAMEFLIQWNANLHLPESLSALETSLRTMEESAEKISQVILKTDTVWGMISGILIIGILTGFSEELFFRGGFQNILLRTKVGRNMSVWLAAILFSVMHFQFFGFFPRLLMGVFFGYLVVWTGSLWTAVFAHALNNSFVVVSSAINGPESVGTAVEGYWSSPTAIIISFVLTTLFFILRSRSPIFNKIKVADLP